MSAKILIHPVCGKRIIDEIVIPDSGFNNEEMLWTFGSILDNTYNHGFARICGQLAIETSTRITNARTVCTCTTYAPTTLAEILF